MQRQFDNLGQFEPVVQQLKKAEEDIYKIPVKEIPERKSELTNILSMARQFMDNPKLADFYRDRI